LQFIGSKADMFVVTSGAADYNHRASVCGIIRVYGVEDSVAGKPEDHSGREVGFRDQSYIDFVHIEKRLEFQAMRRKAVDVPESNT
jgi:hypothetical protein